MFYIKKFDTLSAQTDYLAEAGIDTYVGYVDENDTVYYDDALPDYKNMYFTIKSLDDDNTIYLKASNSTITKAVSVSTDNGKTWTEYTSSADGSGTTLATLNKGGKLLVKGENNAYGAELNYQTQYNQFKTTGQFEAKGNIMSLVSGDSFENADTLTENYALTHLFSQCTGLTSAKNLVLPATTLTDYCYDGMFSNCTSLTIAPVLPATTLANYCYGYMFQGCTSLTTAPELPATALANGCYIQMFARCTSLTTAPELPATTLVKGCYQYMFYGCTSLNSITCLATTLADYSTDTWLSGVAASGTFVKNAAMNDWTTGTAGIPDGWTVQDA